MGKIKVWEKPTILILGIEETSDPGSANNDQSGWVICTKHRNHVNMLFPANSGHGDGVS